MQKYWMRILGAGVLALVGVAAPVWAVQPSVTTREEIAYLFSYLEKSGCEFNRNGSWFAATEASEHLKDKYAYLLDKGLVGSTESFIERAASESSMSGKAYQVKCANAPVLKSAEWFGKALATYRKAAVASAQ